MSDPAPAPPNSLAKNADKNEAKKRAKLEKLAAKQAKMAASQADTTTLPKKVKEVKAKKEDAAPAPPFVNPTPAGEKKDLSAPLAAAYDPQVVEAAWFDWWEKEGFFKPQTTTGPDGKPTINPRGKFVIPIPPPNVTGALHIGHGLTISIQDCLIRWNRMLGKTVLYNPGCDHAGIATQAVVEKRLWKEKKQTRHDIGREAFISEVWKWKDAFGGRIYKQLRSLGGSFDWERAKFTLDPDLSKAVNEAFVRLHEEGVIYRASRLVNWSTTLNTAISNLEVDNKELAGRTLLTIPGYEKKVEFGVITSFAYPIEGSDERIVVATTRPETMLGDTAIAVHPADSRYTHLHGKFATHPFISGRRIPIICDDIAVDMAFGTGAVKITPAHDPNDFEVGKRHSLGFINILNDDGTLNQNAGQFAGVKRFDARYSVVAALKDLGLFVGAQDNPMSVPVCSRSGDVIEPLIKPQWWVRCEGLAKDAMDAVRSGEVEIHPKLSEREWFRWLENIQDWCISRQLWWGHRVPAYFIAIQGRDASADRSDDKYWVSGRDETEARAKAEAAFPDQAFSLEQDVDVLDTWFSAGLWPFSIMGWPEKTEDLDLYYPNSLLETGWDIIFFWVARMVMLGIKLTGKAPFSKILCHAMIRDAHGRKMSKSLGNVIDPLFVIRGISLQDLQATLQEGNLDAKEMEKAKAGQAKDYPQGIPECGTDALRFALCAYTSGGRDINLDILRVEGYRKFCNKLWNATRFALAKLGEGYTPAAAGEPIFAPGSTPSLPERWIIHRLNEAAKEVNASLGAFNFMAATTAIYNFWLYELCDVFIELAKPVIDGSDAAARASYQRTLYACLEAGLKLLHPFMPFVTEELFQRLPRRANDPIRTICLATFPEEDADLAAPAVEADLDLLMSVVRGARSLLETYRIRGPAHIYLSTGTPEDHALLSAAAPLFLQALVKGAGVVDVLAPGSTPPAGTAPYIVSSHITVLLLVRGMVDIDAEVAKLEAEKAKKDAAKAALAAKTIVPGYAEKVRPEIQAINAEKLSAFDAEMDTISRSIQDFLRLRDD